MRVNESIKAGKGIPDEVYMREIRERMKQSDAVVNGWVVCGFPSTVDQIQLLRAEKVIPNLVCLFEQPFETSVARLGNRRIDPNTGQMFNLEVC